MSEPSLALQKAVRSRLVASSAVTTLVPAAAILDRNSRPEGFPCILIGEAQTVPGEGLARRVSEIYADLHIWQTEPGLAQCKAIAGAIRNALEDTIWSTEDFQIADLYINSSRFLRDPDGIHSHGVITLQAILVRAG